MQPVTLSLDAIQALVTQVLVDNGSAADQARAVADIVTRAEADACRSHGLYRVAGYVAALRSGRVNPAPVPRAVRRAPAVVQVDGDRGFAPLAAQAGQPMLVEAARGCGIAAMALGNTHHFSALWADVEPLVAEGLIAWCFVVGQCSVAPHGGTRRLMGTNPVAFGWPRPEGTFLFDFATSAAARGEVELKRLAGEPLPAGWAIDAAGRPTTDPAEALAGALLPFGGHKGSALSMMVELIAGPLIGEMTSRQVAARPIHDGGPPPGGALLIALDPAVFGHDARHAGEALFGDAAQDGDLRLPGERRHAARAKSLTEGVAVPADLLQQIEALLAA